MSWTLRMRCLLGALILLLAPRRAPADPTDPAQVQRMLKLLAGVASEYREAFDDKGAIVRPLDLDETKLMLDEVRDLTAPMRANDRGFDDIVNGLTTLVGLRVPPDLVAAYSEVARRYLVAATGIREDIVPPERPSLERGRVLFQENCTGCHGSAGAGDGADAARLGLKPANFTDRDFMRGETPRDAFNVILLGRQKGGMPAWGDALSPQQSWDLVGYVWSLSRVQAEVNAGRAVYETRCAGCHGADGDPVSSSAGVLDRPSRSLSALVESADHSDTDLFQMVSGGVPNTTMPAFATLLGDADRRNVVAFVRTLSLEGAAGASPESMETDQVAALHEIHRAVDAALDAHRRGDAGAVAYATNAYLRFEPLEKVLAESDASRVDPLEQTFVAFRTALRDPAAGDPAALGQQLQTGLDDVEPLLQPRRASTKTPAGYIAAVAVALLALTLTVRRWVRA
jgi:mono/diheme cytochrome c family protein